MSIKRPRLKLLVPILLATTSQTVAQSNHQFSGVVQAGYVISDSQQSFLNSGSGILRHDSDSLILQQAIALIESDWSTDFSSKVVINAYSDGDQKLSLSQAELSYQPLIKSTLKYKVRVGMFYPELSVENTDIGWLSPYTYTQSAINSWIGEELRIFGVEASLFKSGRRSSSPWSWDAKVGLYKGNDPLGSVIAWRGFGMHDRQSVFDERLEFAAYPFVVSADGINHPAWVEPFHELDKNVGAYIGLHINYLRRTEVKYYRYDNLADPNVVNSQRLYPWRTKFHSIAINHQIDKQWQIKGQFMYGATLMGQNFVHVDYVAGFVQGTYKLNNKHKLSTRIDIFDVAERDDIPEDINTSYGHAFTLNYQFKISENWRLGSELHFNKNTALNRATLGISPEQYEKQWLFIADYRF